MKGIGETKTILGVNRARDRGSRINQKLYLQKILRRFNMEEIKCVSTLLDCNQKLSAEMSAIFEEKKNSIEKVSYQEAMAVCMLHKQVDQTWQGTLGFCKNRIFQEIRRNTCRLEQ